MKQKGEDLYFVEIRETSEVRRNVLESLKEILEVLQRFEKFKHMRNERVEIMQKLRSLIKSTNKMFGNLKSKMPQTDLKPAMIRNSTHPKKEVLKKKSKPVPQKTPKKVKTEIEKLEDELNAIEGKLKNLS